MTVLEWVDEELANAATMIPGFFLAMRHFNRVRGTYKRLAFVAFAALCCNSIVYHLTDASDPWKRALLRLDIVTQQVAAIATALSSHRPGSVRSVASCLAIVALACVSATVPVDVRSAKMVGLQAAIALFANGFRVGPYWLLSLSFRAYGMRFPNSISHGLFHLAVLKAFDDMWSTW